jgi:hypothetical protein
VHHQWGTLCEGTSSHKLLIRREKEKFEQGENVLLGELFQGTIALFAVEEHLHKNVKGLCVPVQKICLSFLLKRMPIKAESM